MKEYIQLYLEAVLPKFPIEGITCIREHLTSRDTLAHVSRHLGTKDIILAAVSLHIIFIASPNPVGISGKKEPIC